MSRVVVEYNPNIKQQSKKEISERVTYSMESIDGDSFQYCLDTIVNGGFLTDENDANFVEKLLDDGVHYLEF